MADAHFRSKFGVECRQRHGHGRLVFESAFSAEYLGERSIIQNYAFGPRRLPAPKPTGETDHVLRRTTRWRCVFRIRSIATARIFWVYNRYEVSQAVWEVLAVPWLTFRNDVYVPVVRHLSLPRSCAKENWTGQTVRQHRKRPWKGSTWADPALTTGRPKPRWALSEASAGCCVP